ncbi:CCA tRNA nucleotidyltransferase, mitochondrial [Kappamyces sp. JEL0829]|nr:CCA tRNA nucleotidyltransferase, mitochondrial [Kappamyces sp. JEL0829]
MSAPRIVLTEVEKTIQTILTNFTNHLGQKNPGVPSPQLRIAGGWVRDKLLGKESHDIDIAIDNMKGEPFAQELKTYLVQIGMNMSSISKIQLNPDKSKHLETATARLFDLDVDFVNLRSETYNDDSRHPEMVGCWLSYIEEFGTPLQDALRRDITINTLFYNLHTEAVEDYTGHGLDDLKNRIIRTPLPPLQTFLDDPLRILRVIRFASRFDYSLYPDIVEATKDATLRTAFEKKISRERVGVEVEKMLLGPNPQRAVSLISEFGFYDLVFACPDGIVPDSVPAERSSASIKYSTILKLFLAPFRTATHKVKSKVHTIVRHIVLHSLKLSIYQSDFCERLLVHADAIASAAKKHAQAPLDRKTIGLLVRDIGARPLGKQWDLAVLLALVVELYDCELESIVGGAGQPIIDRYSGLVKHIFANSLQTAHDLKPILDGKSVAKVLNVKPGPHLGVILQELIEWQMEQVQPSEEQAIKHLQSKYLAKPE